MDISLQSLIFFIIITIIYFAFPSIGKPQLQLTDLTDNGVSSDFYGRTNRSLLFYVGAILVSQLFLNVGYLMGKCGGSLDKNIGVAALFTFIPWVLMFGIMLVVLIMFPNLKSAFSDVLGYFAVSNSANELFSKILIGTDINQQIDQEIDQNKKQELTKAAEAIMKICGNKSILINQMTPDNFLNIWNNLKPLMLPNVYENVEIKQQLIDIVTLKENIGEAFWYVYTAILISSIVYYNLATRGCVKSVDQIKADHDAYIKQNKETTEKEKLNNSTKYTA